LVTFTSASRRTFCACDPNSIWAGTNVIGAAQTVVAHPPAASMAHQVHRKDNITAPSARDGDFSS
jgi:hypothetical protein